MDADLGDREERRAKRTTRAAGHDDTLQRILEAIPAAIFISDKQGHPQYANKEAVRILGKGVLPGLDASELAEVYQAFVAGTDDLYPEEQMPLIRALSGESCWADDMEIRHPSGTRTLHVSASPLYGESGEVEMAIAAFVDVTVQKESEDLRESLLAALPIAVRVYNDEGMCVLQNQLAASLSGEDTLETFHNFHHVESWKKHGLADQANRTLQTGETTQGEVRLTDNSGESRTLEYQFRRFHMRGRKHILMRFGDVTERNAMAERSRRQKKLLEAMNKVLLLAVAETSEDELATAFLSAAQNLTGSSSGFVGMLNPQDALNLLACAIPGREGTPTSIVDAAEAQRALIEDGPLRRALTTHRPQLVQSGKGDCSPVSSLSELATSRSVLVVPLTDQDEVIGLIALADGESAFSAQDQKDIEALSAWFVEAIKHHIAVVALEDRTSALQRSNESLEQFAYVASHDLQEPLRVVSSYTQLLASRYEDLFDESASRYMHHIVDAASRMQQLIRDLLQYSRVQSKGKEFLKVDLNEALGRAHINLKSIVEESSAVVTNEELPAVFGDEMQLASVFQNLLGNAMKFSGEAIPHIHISAEDRGAEWVISIQDNGIGISSEYHDRIFGIFQRLHTRSQYEGTGIGLSLCKSIIERHGGGIWVESEEGNGSVFKFSIPKYGKD